MKGKHVLKIFFVLVPVIVVVSGYYFYIYGGAKKKVYATANDIQYIARSIHDTFGDRKYKDFGNDTVVYSNALPFSMEPVQTPLGYQIYNRFGGKMYFYEAFSKLDERAKYFALYNDTNNYKQYYDGSGAYIILLTNLLKQECVMLARVDWRRFVPNFLGLEVSVADPNFPYNGMYNLKHYLLLDNLGEQYESSDQGILSRRSLSQDMAEKACSCRWKTCMVALKFL